MGLHTWVHSRPRRGSRLLAECKRSNVNCDWAVLTGRAAGGDLVVIHHGIAVERYGAVGSISTGVGIGRPAVGL